MSTVVPPQPYHTFADDGSPQWSGDLPNSCSVKVADALLKVASRVATKGIGEKQKAKGFLFIAGEAKQLLTKGCIGNLGRFNKYEAHYVTVFDVVSDGEAQRFVYPDFISDGAMIIDGRDGRILGHGYTVTANLQYASKQGGKRHEAASASSQTGPCFVVKASEDVCSVDGVCSGCFGVFNGCKEAVEVPVLGSHVATDLSPEELASRIHRLEEQMAGLQAGGRGSSDDGLRADLQQGLDDIRTGIGDIRTHVTKPAASKLASVAKFGLTSALTATTK